MVPQLWPGSENESLGLQTGFNRAALCICFLYSLLHLTLACLHGGPSPVPGALIFGEEDGVCMTGRASSSIHILNY